MTPAAVKPPVGSLTCVHREDVSRYELVPDPATVHSDRSSLTPSRRISDYSLVKEHSRSWGDGEPPRFDRETHASAYRRCIRNGNSRPRLAFRVNRVRRSSTGVANNIAMSLLVNRVSWKSFCDFRGPLTPALNAGREISAERRTDLESRSRISSYLCDCSCSSGF